MQPESKDNMTQLDTNQSNQQFHFQSTQSNDRHQIANINKYDSHEHHIALQIIGKIVQRNYSRHFIKRLMFTFIESLKKQKINANKRNEEIQNTNWPFKELCLKRHRNQEEQQLYQFINLCAQMIQSKFKSYLTRKRHLIAFSKAKKAHNVLSAFIKRWKAYRTFNCQKIVEIRRKVKQIEKQINVQQQNFTNRDAKKLKGLYKYYQIHTKLFRDTFSLLTDTGMWTLEKNMKPKMFKKIKRNNQNQNIARKISGVNQQIQNVVMQKKVRQPKQKKSIQMQKKIDNKKQNIDQNGQNQFMPNQSTVYSQFEDRPIKATGQYTYNQLQNQNIDISQNQSKLKQAQSQGLGTNNENESKVQQRIKKNQELQKRKKYDPRKAIQEEKKRKKGQLKQTNSQQLKQSQNLEKLSQQIDTPTLLNKVNVVKKQPNKSPNGVIKKQQQTKAIGQEKSKKVIKVKKVNEGQPPKQPVTNLKKVASKVDCWGSKKDPQPDWVKDYKARILQQSKQQRDSNKIQSIRKSLEKNVRKSQQYNNKTQTYTNSQNEANFDKKISSLGDRIMMMTQNSEKYEDKKTVQTWQMRQRQIQNLKQKQNEYFGKRKNSTHNLQEQVKTIIERKNNLKRKQVHRPIEQLQQTYSKHYGDRFQNLMPKLSLLGVTRNQQRNSRIPVISDHNEQFNEWFQKLYFSTQFWKEVGMHEKKYKSFILS